MKSIGLFLTVVFFAGQASAKIIWNDEEFPISKGGKNAVNAALNNAEGPCAEQARSLELHVVYLKEENQFGEKAYTVQAVDDFDSLGVEVKVVSVDIYHSDQYLLQSFLCEML